MKNPNAIWNVVIADDAGAEDSYWIHGGSMQQAIKKALACARRDCRAEVGTFRLSDPRELRCVGIKVAGTIDG